MCALPLLCALVIALSIGTNLGLWRVLLALGSGKLLGTRDALIPTLSDIGVMRAAVYRAWQAFAQGAWQSLLPLRSCQQLVRREGRWEARGQAAELQKYFV
jgi:hypothetical protein